MERLTKRNENGTIGIGEPLRPYNYQDIKDVLEKLAAYEDTGLEPQEIERIVDAYGRCQTLRTESALRLEIIREIPTEKLQDIAKQYRMSKLAKQYRYGKFK